MKKFLKIFGVICLIFFIWQVTKVPATTGDWQEHLTIPSTAEFNGDSVTIKNVRNYRYGPTEADMHPGYYDRTYDLTQLKDVWYITEPFNDMQEVAHTFVSFEFSNGDFLAITIEARKLKGQDYSVWKGLIKTYPLIYVAADERDVVMLRANLRKDNVYTYPVKFENEENKRLFLVDMLETMNKLLVEPTWYNTLFSNCTSSIAKHVNKISPGRISLLSWELWLTASADELALEHGLLDTELTIEQAREKYLITPKSQEIGDVPNYSQEIRKFD
ncbi:MAG: DUF4105 domain-containing protein [Patescibacteria group bacterium]